MSRNDLTTSSDESSPAARGPAGAYIEGELGAFYLLALLADIEPRGLPGARLGRVRYQGVDQGFALDDLVIQGSGSSGPMLLELQSKRTITFAPSDRVFAEVCQQLARTSDQGIPEDRHRLAVATQRTSKAISGPYQDVLEWARKAANGAEFFRRVGAKGVSGPDMRKFAETFRANLVDAGVANHDEDVWRLVRRFSILEFDFESSAPLARTLALVVAKQILAPGDATRVEALWSNLIEVSLERAKSGGYFERTELREILTDRGFAFSGDRNHSAARRKLAERTQHALADIGNTVAGVRLPRRKAVEALDLALNEHRFVEIRGGPGVGKSAVLKHAAERIVSQSNVLVLDPVSTPEGGWGAMAHSLSLDGTAQEFLADLATSGGAVIFIDGLEMFTSPGRRRTINDLLREVAQIEGVAVVATCRPEFGQEGDDWVAPESKSKFGPIATVVVGELDDEEVEALHENAPELRALLEPGHAAAAIVRNLYRLSRMLKVPSATTIRSEAALANHWWQTADSAEVLDRRAAQRLMADLAEATLAGNSEIEARYDSPARMGLLRSRTLAEPRRDHLRFYHDVLRDWAVGSRLHEELAHLNVLDLGVPAPANIARGIEFAGRFALELTSDSAKWLALLDRLSVNGAHSSWRRHALLAILRSELSASLLERTSADLIARDAILLAELCTAVTTVETVSPDELSAGLSGESAEWAASLPKSFRIPVTSSAVRLMEWCVRHAKELPLPAVSSVLSLARSLCLLLTGAPRLAGSISRMLFDWLRQLDEKDAVVVIPPGSSSLRDSHGATIAELRAMALLLCEYSPEQTKAYLRAVTATDAGMKLKEIRPFSAAIARVAPQELADLVAMSLIGPRRRRGRSLGGEFGFNDGDFLPPSPAQTPFLDLLNAAPAIGLDLVRKLVEAAFAFRSGNDDPDSPGFTIAFEAGMRRFPGSYTYLWSRDQAREYSVASALMALEAWGHGRIGAGEQLDSVVADVLGPDGGCAAYILVAVDILLSCWPGSRDQLVPFLASPELLVADRSRAAHDPTSAIDMGFAKEPVGKVRLSDLRAKPSRGIALENVLAGYVQDDATSRKLRALLTEASARVGDYGAHANFGDPAFMCAHALNITDPANWDADGDRHQYRSPPREAEHLARIEANHAAHRRASDIELRIQLAVHETGRATAGLARDAVLYANGELPDGSPDADVLESRSTRLAATAMLVASVGDDELLTAHEDWVCAVVTRILSQNGDGLRASRGMLAYNPQALSVLAITHLWLRRRLATYRETMLCAAARQDGSAVIAFTAAAERIKEVEPRVLKSAIRVAFASSRWKDTPWNEPEEEAGTRNREKEACDRVAIAAEICWLDGGPEPSWPIFPEEHPVPKRNIGIRIPRSKVATVVDTLERDDYSTLTGWHVDQRAISQWLGLLANEGPTREWQPEVVKAYSAWSAGMNGLGKPPHFETVRAPSEWNGAFYSVVSNVMMDAEPEWFNELLAQILKLPDTSFGDIVETLLLASDVCYFNDAASSADRLVEIRHRIAARVAEMRDWGRERRPGDLSISYDTGGVVARLLLNTHNPIGGTATYLVPAVFDRIDPILTTLRPVMGGGPTPFVALCTMNALLVQPRVRHLDFVLFASEAWLGRLPSDARTWVDLGIGLKLVDWMNAVTDEDPSIWQADYPLRKRIDNVLGQLVKLGVPGSYELERRVH